MKLSLRSYIRHVRKQHEHVQRLHAFLFAGSVTFILVVLVLYVQYGFWHTTYEKEEVVEEAVVTIQSPGETFARLFSEGKIKLKEALENSSPFTSQGETFDRNTSSQ